jgi:hypothetical protein
VVTLFTRAVHTGGQLYIEWAFHVLPPLRDAFLSIDRFSSQTRLRQLGASSMAGVGAVLPGLIRSPDRVVVRLLRSSVQQRRSAAQVREVARGRLFNYGALPSIRETACGPTRGHYFLDRDESMYMLLTEQALMRAIGEFLDEKKISAERYTEQVNLIVNKIGESNIYVAGDISGQGVAVGHGAEASSWNSGNNASRPESRKGNNER